MSRLDDLPADQHAVLQMLLARDQSYGRIAEMLDLEEETVRSRAHAAVDALGPESGRRLPDERRAAVADYLLGQQDDEASAATREHLEASAGARAWARVVSGELRGLAGERELPEIPPDGARRARAERARPRSRNGAATAQATGEEAEEVDTGGDVASGHEGARRSSRVGGALLIGGLAILVAVLVVLLVKGGSGGDDPPTTSTAAGATRTQATTTQPTKVLAQVNMKGEGKSLGLAQVLIQGQQRAIAIRGQDLKPTTKTAVYAVWLYNAGDDAARLGYAPAVGKNGRLQGVAALPANAAKYKELVVTRESSTTQATTPGTIVLRGRLGLTP